MAKKPTTPNFTFSQDVLIQTAKSKANFIERDAAEFSNYNVTDTNVTAFREKITEMEDSPADVEETGTQAVATEIKNAAAVKLKEAVRSIMSRARNKFGEDSARYRKFGTKGLSDMTDAQLLRCAGTVHRAGTAFLSELESEGLTEDVLTELKSLRTAFSVADSAQEDAIADRDIASEDRVILANEIYADMVKFCNTGKTIWASKNEARYNDYVIYNTPSGGPEPDAVV